MPLVSSFATIPACTWTLFLRTYGYEVRRCDSTVAGRSIVGRLQTRILGICLLLSLTSTDSGVSEAIFQTRAVTAENAVRSLLTRGADAAVL